MKNIIDFELKKSNKKAVLLFHGLTGSPFEMKKYGNFLSLQGFDVFCYSLPGHGEKLDEIQSISYRNWCDFAQSKYSLLRPDYEEFYISGLCLGAAIAIYLGENNKDISGIVALSTTLFLDGTSIPWYNFLMPMGLYTILRYYYTFPEDDCLGIKNPDTRKKLSRIIKRTTVGMDNYPLSCVYELLQLSKYVCSSLKNIQCPILLIHSRLDNLSSTKSAKIVMEKSSSQIKKYLELNDSYHMILYDNEKILVMETVKEFLNMLSTKSSKLENV